MQWIRECFLCKSDVRERRSKTDPTSYERGYECVDGSCDTFYDVYVRAAENGSIAMVCAITIPDSVYASLKDTGDPKRLFFKKCFVCSRGIVHSSDGSDVCENETCGVRYELHEGRIHIGRVVVTLVMKIPERIFLVLLSQESALN
ncbi:MAG: hypothetical protein HYY60_01695 [Parcubacteria group bacterium]|nr:hypothetical protein [Parcubacteria group bacterium]MBI3074783.1 hypothetical protein [Parcubacteria group bacterium]